MESSTPEWYLDVQGRRIGPFSLEQIRGFLEEGEILPDHRVTSEQMQGEWQTVADLVASSRAANEAVRPTPNLSGTFQPPPRPPEVAEDETLQEEEPTARPDPALSLFDALQAARERKAARLAPPVSGSWGKVEKKRRQIPRKAWIAFSASFLLVILLWSVGKWLFRKSEAPAKGSVATSLNAPVRAAPPAPPAGSLPAPRPHSYTPPPRPGLPTNPTAGTLSSKGITGGGAIREGDDDRREQDDGRENEMADPRDAQFENEAAAPPAMPPGSPLAPGQPAIPGQPGYPVPGQPGPDGFVPPPPSE